MTVSRSAASVIVAASALLWLPVSRASCVDLDGDGYGSPGDVTCPAGGQTDCSDADALINPGRLERCENAVDDDCDTFIDGSDPECALDAPRALWSIDVGGTGNDIARAVTPTSDGGVIITGSTASFAQGGATDAWVMKFDPLGAMKWQRTYGGSGSDEALAAAVTADGGAIVAGTTDSFGAGSKDFFVLRLDAIGGVLWRRTWGGPGEDRAAGVVQTADGGFAVVGTTASFGSGGKDLLVLKLNGNGGQVWARAYGGAYDDTGQSIAATSDGGLVATGSASWNDSRAFSGLWVLRLTSTGSVVWETQASSDYSAEGFAVRELTGGGFVAAGRWLDPIEADNYSLVLRLDAAGAPLWQLALGRLGIDSAYGTAETGDGGIVIASTASEDYSSFAYGVLARLDAQGALLWIKKYDRWSYFRNDEIYSLAPTGGGELLVAGQTGATDSGPQHVWVMKLDLSGEISTQCGFPAPLLPWTRTAPIVHQASTVTDATGTLITPAHVMRATGAAPSVHCQGSSDQDRDGVANDLDNCPSSFNPGQEDSDGDAFGDPCDCSPLDGTTFPGAPQLCDGRANDCSDPAWPSVPANEVDADHDGFRLCGGDCNDADGAVYPGAPQRCDRKNNDCSAPAWPVTPSDEVDNDGDALTECEGDCDDLNGDVWATPGEVRLLRFPSPTRLEWAAPLSPGGALIAYDTLRSMNPVDFVGAATCVESDDGHDTRATDSTTPAPGLAFAYLVRAQNDCPAGEGSLGTTSSGAERLGRSCP